MQYTKTIVCLANSRKPPSGRCIAGLEFDSHRFGDWVRPVSSRATREISEEEKRFENGRHPRVLDVLSIPMRAHAPESHQTENHEIDDGYYWQFRGVLGWKDLQLAVEQWHGPLWTNGDSTFNGINDQVADALLSRFQRSLHLIRPQNLKLKAGLDKPPQGKERRRVRADFDFAGHHYCLVVTDPVVEEHYLQHPGEYSIRDAVMYVSLSDAWNGYAYKLAASIITPSRSGG